MPFKTIKIINMPRSLYIKNSRMMTSKSSIKKSWRLGKYGQGDLKSIIHIFFSLYMLKHVYFCSMTVRPTDQVNCMLQ